MISLFYTLSIRLFGMAIRLAAPFNHKAKLWVEGRKDWRKKLRDIIGNEDDIIWFHCSSLGEFEQGNPVIQALISKGEKVLLTFYSPSGYENKKHLKGVLGVCYMPLDTKSNAADFLDIVKPKSAIFVKYEFWFNFLDVLGKRGCQVFLVSGIFRKSQHFFKWYGSWFRKRLRIFSTLFVQDENSVQLLHSIGLSEVQKAGDTRFDRVIDIAGNPKAVAELKSFAASAKVITAGSTWKEDEKLLKEVLKAHADIKLVVAPHEVNEERIQEIRETFGIGCLLFRDYNGEADVRVLIINELGILSSAYQYTKIAFIGGGFGKGIHNTLEAAVYGNVLFFGPNYQRFKEAVDLISAGGAFSVNSAEEMNSALNKLKEQSHSDELGEINRKYVAENKGATAVIIGGLSQKGILRN